MDKFDGLMEALRSCGSVVIAFSGGTDSTLVAAATREAGVPALAVTAASPLLPPRELMHAGEVARYLGLQHREVQSGEWEIEEVRGNLRDRCYRCKRRRFALLLELAEEEGYGAVADGSHLDDREQLRPGMRAARELGVRSPLREAGMDGRDVRQALRDLGLQRFLRPSRSCLATRFPYGTILEEEELERIDRAEEWLEQRGVRQVRLRWEGPGRVRIEVEPPDLARLAGETLRSELLAFLKSLGYGQAVLDLRGYRSGSMDEPSR